MFGDPHFVTFDKADPVFMAKNVGSALNYFWAVNSANIEIQGLSSGGDSWMQGVAITGGFLNGNSLIAVKDPSSGGGFKVLWNGEQILRSEGDSAHPMEHVQLYRNKAAQYLPTDAEFQKVFGVASKKNWFQGGQVMRQWKGNKDVFSFALPKNVQVFLTVSQVRTPEERPSIPDSFTITWCRSSRDFAQDATTGSTGRLVWQLQW